MKEQLHRKRLLLLGAKGKYEIRFLNMTTTPKCQHCMRETSFPVMRKVGNAGIYVLLTFESKIDIVISRINFNLQHYDKFKFALKLIWLATVFNLDLFPLEVVQ